MIESKDEFNKTHFETDFTLNDNFYVSEIVPIIHYTMGGLAINENCQLLNKNNEIINNIYAVGEVSGGLHGKNRLAGNSLLECVVFGKRAVSLLAPCHLKHLMFLSFSSLLFHRFLRLYGG